VITFPAGWSGNENTDSRYKFRLTDCNAPIDWIFPGNHDNTPDGNDNWWYVAEDPDRDADQWDDGHVWKVADHAGWSNSTYDITFSLNPESAYTHHLFPTTSSITVEPVAALTAPADNSSITLDALSSDISFEWAATQASDGSAVTYAIAFIAESGDFSTPLFTAPSGNGGQDNSVTLTHTQLNSIATDAGIAPGAQGNLKWTVFASRGTDSRQATVTNTLTVTRIAGFDILPEAAYLTGDATEAGTVLSNALPLKKTAAGIFEIYTRLETGKTFSFTDGTAGTPRNFNIVGGKLDETAGQASNVASTAVYKVSLDFNTGGVLFTEITQVAFYYPWDQINVVLTYTGNGVWTGSETPSGWNSDTRYKFKVTAGGTVKDWIGIDYRNAEPDGTDEFYYMKEGNNEGQWTGEDNNMWKIPSAFGGWNSGTFYFTFSLKADEPYTHLITKQ
ncbi:MAG: SusE domain-containing protein, partial [Bacteroidales bacterium]|jgi:hypothetical protein|nr:SusE domain-containing protein [Bacteroidales bacterium]